MTEDITSLQIRILYDSVTQAEKRLAQLEKTGSKTEKTVKGIGGGMSAGLKSLYAFATGAAVVTASVAAMRAVINKTAEFQKLRAGLITATGDIENARVAFEALQDYAQSTPSSLVEVTEAFTKLVNYGLTPSERALNAYGNTASAMGKTLNQMVEAVADATTGEFERLKEFGIKAKTEGDNITFRFRGVSTTVKNSAKEIEEYLMGLGETNFSGAMAQQMDTLNGKFSALGDEWDKLLAGIGENGLGQVAGDGIQLVIDLLAELNAQIASGELQANIDGMTHGWRVFGESVGEAVGEIWELIDGFFQDVTGGNESMLDSMITHFERLPLKWKLGAEVMGNVMFALVDTVKQVGILIYENFAASFDKSVGAAVIAGRAIASAIADPLNAIAIGQQGMADIAANAEAANAKLAKAQDQFAAKLEINKNVAISGATTAWADYNKAVAEIESKKAEADKKREDYDKARAERLASGKDRLEPFGVGVDTGGNGKPKSSGGGGSGGGERESEFDRLVDELQREELAIAESFNRRLDLIRNNTEAGSELRAELELSATEKFEEEQLRRIESLKSEPETMFQAFEQAEQVLEDSYERRKDIILSATEYTEAEKLKLLEEAEAKHTALMRKNEVERTQAALEIASGFFENIATIGKAFGKKGAKVAKGAAIAKATIDTYSAATGAYSAMASIPYVGPALGVVAAAAAVAAGMANVAKIKSQDDSGGYSGAYATGGLIPPGGFGVVGEAGPEIVRGPALVTSAQRTRDTAQAGAGGGSVAVNVHNYAGAEVETRSRETQDGKVIDLIVKRVESKVNRGLAEGSSPLGKTIEKTYGLRRKGA